jgi:hypothetical protein
MRYLAPLILVALVPGGAIRAQSNDDFRWSRVLGSGKRLEVIGVNGDIEARGGSGREAVVTAVKRGHRSDPEDVKIEVVEDQDGVTICAVYPSWRNHRPNECRRGGEGHHETRDNDVKVHFTVTVPRGVELIARTVNGEVEATDLDGNADAHSVNGSVVLETTGYGSATTVNGSVRARLGRGDWDDELEFSTVNGSIELVLPSSVETEIRASSLNGGIDSDFPLTVKRGRFGPKRISGTIGRGGRSLELSTVNGRMEIRRGS